MDYIKKIICIEDARTRTQGIMPYYEFGKEYNQHGTGCSSVSSLGLEVASGDNGNWGQFVANPCFLARKGKTYESMVQKYYDILNIVRDGTKLRKVQYKENEVIFTEDLDGFSYNNWDNCFSGGTDIDLYDFTAYPSKYFYSTEIHSLRDGAERVYKSKENILDTFIVLIDDYDSFQKLASYLDGTEYAPFTGEHKKWSAYCEQVDKFIGRLSVPASIYNKHLKVPKTMAYADVKSYRDWLRDYQTLSADCCNLRLWEDRGGDEMLDFLNSKIDEVGQAISWVNSLTYAVPCIEMPLLISQNFTDVGTLTNIDGTEYVESYREGNGEGKRPHGRGNQEKAFTIDQISMKPKRKSYPKSGDGSIEVESLLKTLRNRKKYMDDDDNVLPGMFQSFSNPAGVFVRCTKSGGGWTVSECGGGGLLNGDGKTSAELANTNYYRSVTTKAAAKRIAEVYEEEPGTPAASSFYFRVKYNNSESTHMTIPYAVGNATNVYLVDEGRNIYRGDFIIGLTATSVYVDVKYVVGGFFRGTDTGEYVSYDGGGDVYYERRTLDTKHVDYVSLDGVDNVPVWSDYIDFEGDAKEFYSPRYNLYRTGTTANIIEASVLDTWNKDYAYDAYLAKEDYLINFSNLPKVDVNVTIDRGGVSAFEKHYKLTECNTMQDLETYGNGWFLPDNQ